MENWKNLNKSELQREFQTQLDIIEQKDKEISAMYSVKEYEKLSNENTTLSDAIDSKDKELTNYRSEAVEFKTLKLEHAKLQADQTVLMNKYDILGKQYNNVVAVYDQMKSANLGMLKNIQGAVETSTELHVFIENAANQTFNETAVKLNGGR